MARTEAIEREYVLQTLLNENQWKVGYSETFTAMLSQEWEFTLRKEEEAYAPYKYALTGRKIGTAETCSRRYRTMEDAFLHILNHLNENANVRNRYSKLSEWLLGRK